MCLTENNTTVRKIVQIKIHFFDMEILSEHISLKTERPEVHEFPPLHICLTA